MNPRKGHFHIARTTTASEIQIFRPLTSQRLEKASSLLNLIMVISQTKAAVLPAMRVIVDIQRTSSTQVEEAPQMRVTIKTMVQIMKVTRTIC